MAQRGPPFKLIAARGANGRCPFLEYLESETDPKNRAWILSKLQHAARIDPADHGRPLTSRLEGPIEELREGAGEIRVLFSVERPAVVLLLHGGERKKGTVKVSSYLVQEATELREAWVGGRKGVEIDVAALKQRIKRKRLEWPKE